MASAGVRMLVSISFIHTPATVNITPHPAIDHQPKARVKTQYTPVSRVNVMKKLSSHFPNRTRCRVFGSGTWTTSVGVGSWLDTVISLLGIPPSVSSISEDTEMSQSSL